VCLRPTPDNESPPVKERKQRRLPQYPLLPDALYTLEEVSGHYAIHVTTAWRWVRQGRLEAVRVGDNKTLIRGRSILANDNC
jgi:Helix-turn-helix domain